MNNFLRILSSTHKSSTNDLEGPSSTSEDDYEIHDTDIAEANGCNSEVLC